MREWGGVGGCVCIIKTLQGPGGGGEGRLYVWVGGGYQLQTDNSWIN